MSTSVGSAAPVELERASTTSRPTDHRRIPYEPFEFVDESTESGYSGFDMEIVAEIAERLDLELAVQDSGFDGLASGLALNSQSCDLVASAMTITDDRKKNLDFSDPYYDSKQSLLVASDSDYVPLARKLNTLGTRVMVLGWDFRFTGQDNEVRETRTSQALLGEVSYPVLMSNVIEDRARRYDPLVKDLFVQKGPTTPSATRIDDVPIPDDVTTPGEIVSLQNGYGFLQPDDENEDDLFFFHLDVENADFNALAIGDRVRYVKSMNDRGPCARRIFVVPSDAPPQSASGPAEPARAGDGR